jgi:hypothetical protein
MGCFQHKNDERNELFLDGGNVEDFDNFFIVRDLNSSSVSSMFSPSILNYQINNEDQINLNLLKINKNENNDEFKEINQTIDKRQNHPNNFRQEKKLLSKSKFFCENSKEFLLDTGIGTNPHYVTQPLQSSSQYVFNNQLKFKRRCVDNRNEFSVGFIKGLNECRKNPKIFSKKVHKMMQYIREPKIPGVGSPIFCGSDKSNILVIEGKKAFYNLIELLENTNPMDEIQLVSDLNVKIEEDPKTWTNKKLIAENINKVKLSINHGFFHCFNFHFDIGSSDPEISLILQLVDDTPFKGARQKNLLNPELKYIGVTSLNLKSKNCSYYLLSK